MSQRGRSKIVHLVVKSLSRDYDIFNLPNFNIAIMILNQINKLLGENDLKRVIFLDIKYLESVAQKGST